MMTALKSLLISNVFCPTGPGGGIDPTCTKGGFLGRYAADQKTFPFFSQFKDESTVAELRSRFHSLESTIESIIDEFYGEEVTLYHSWDDVSPEDQEDAMSDWIDQNISRFENEYVSSWKDDVDNEVEYEVRDDDDLRDDQFSEWVKENYSDREGHEEWTFDDNDLDYSEERDFERWREPLLEDIIEERVADRLQDESLPDEYREGAWDDATTHWNQELSSEEKFESSGISRTREIDVPDTYEPFGDAGDSDRSFRQHNYESTRTIAAVVQRELTRKFAESSGVTITDELLEDLPQDVWGSWKESSLSGGGVAVQMTAARVLGGYSQDFDIPRTSEALFFERYLGQHVLGQDAPTAEARAVGRKILEAHVTATWAASQYILKQADAESVNTYRAVYIDNKIINDSPQDEYTVGDDTYKKTPTLAMKRNGAQSTAYGRYGLTVVNYWGGTTNTADKTRVVVRMSVPRESVLSIPAMGKNVKDEHEVVILGTKWNKWDAYVSRAPSIDNVPIE